MQFQADLLGCPVEVAAEPETTALGAAALAGLAVGVWPDEDALAGLVRRGARYEPRAGADEMERRRGRVEPRAAPRTAPLAGCGQAWAGSGTAAPRRGRSRIEEVQPLVVDRQLDLGARRGRRLRVDDGGEDRALVGEQLALVVVAVSAAARTASARDARRSIVKIRWFSDPRSSTTSTTTRRRGSSGSAAAACSKSVGRMPRITLRARAREQRRRGSFELEAGEATRRRRRSPRRRGSSTASR